MVCLLFISNIAKLFLSYPRAFVEGGDSAGWLVAIISSVFSLLYLWLFIVLMKRFPGKTIVEVTEELLGRYLGTVVNLIYAIYFFIVVVMFFRQFGDAMIASTLPRTPISIIVGVFALAAVGTAFFTLDTLARTARLTAPFIIAALVLSLITVSNLISWHNYFPILGNGPLALLIEGLKYSMISEGLIAAMIFPLFQDWDHFRKACVYGVGGGIVALVALVFVFQGVLINNEATEELLPYYRLARMINLGRFFQRIEAIFLLSWGMVGMIKLALTLYAGVLVLTRTFRLSDYRPILWLSLILTYALAFAPPDLPSAIALDNFTRMWGYLPNVFIPILLLVLAGLKKKRGQRLENNKI